MENYIKGNKEAWEEAFEMRDEAYGKDIEERVQNEPYAYFYEADIEVLKKYDLKDKTIGQFCCNNGCELMSLVKTTGAKEGIGFDIASNMVAFANEKAHNLSLPCKFIEANVLELDHTYHNYFDFFLLTVGANCWFKSLRELYAVVAKCMKRDACIVIIETHPTWNMIAVEGEEDYDEKHPFDCIHSYFNHEWIGTSGMGYMTGKEYKSKTFTDYTHPLSEFISAMCENGMVVTGMQETDIEVSGGSEKLSGKGFPLSMILEGKKIS